MPIQTLCLRVSAIHVMTEETTMDDQTWIAAFEAQFLMGHSVPAPHLALDRTTITGWSWDVDQVRQALHVPANALWDERIVELEMHGLASFSMYAAPVTWDEQGQEHVIPGWQDEPSEKWGSLDITPQGVLRLAELYGRPYRAPGGIPSRAGPLATGTARG